MANKKKIIDGVEYELVPTGRVFGPPLMFIGNGPDGSVRYRQYEEYKKIKVGDIVKYYSRTAKIVAIYKQSNSYTFVCTDDLSANVLDDSWYLSVNVSWTGYSSLSILR